MLSFYICGKAHISATNLELFRSLTGIEHDTPRCRHVGVVGRYIVMPPTPNSSARCRKITLPQNRLWGELATPLLLAAPPSCRAKKHPYFLMLPGQFVPGRTFGMLRSAMISTAIFDTPLQPTEKPCSFQN